MIFFIYLCGKEIKIIKHNMYICSDNSLMEEEDLYLYIKFLLGNDDSFVFSDYFSSDDFTSLEEYQKIEDYVKRNY